MIMGFLGFIIVLPIIAFMFHYSSRKVNESCVNPVILSSRPFVDNKLPSDFEIKFVTVHQRHLDRWIYQHDFIENICWPHQLNSTSFSTACDYPLSSVWETFERTADPYAAPAFGNCNAKQLTKSGILHSQALGTLIKQQYPGLLKSCSRKNVMLECDDAQKNQHTVQNVFRGMCGSLPDPMEYSAKSVVDHGDIASGKPWWLSTGRCGNSDYDSMMEEALQAMVKSELFRSMKTTVSQVAEASSKPMPEQKDYATLLDNLEDCWVCHECLGLQDVPKAFQDEELTNKANELETASRVYPLKYFEEQKEFSMMHFGYYFKVLLDRMRSVIDGGSEMISIQVTSDSILTPQLEILGAPEEMYRLRPVWGSTIVYELYQNVNSDNWVVRILFNGESIPLCGDSLYCAWGMFEEKISSKIPSQDLCPNIYEFYP